MPCISALTGSIYEDIGLAIAQLRKSSSLMGFAVQVGDWCAFALAGAFAYFWRFGEHLTEAETAVLQLVIASSFLMLLMSSFVYRTWRGGQLPAMLGRVALAWAITWGLMMTWLVLTKSSESFSRMWLGAWGVASLLLTWMVRTGLYMFMSLLQGKGVSELRVLLVGSGKSVTAIRRRVKASAWTGYKVVGVTPGDNTRLLEEAVAKLSPDEVWICQQPGDMRAAENVLHTLRHSTANIRLVPDLTLLQLVNHGVSIVVGVPMLDLSSSPMEGGSALLKWVEDKVLGFLIFLLISPLLLVIGIAVKLSSKGPAIFKQRRLGWNGETILIYKFRSMYEHDEGPRVAQATKGDPRITPLGRFLRSTSLDELPQFINVLQGSMSIVGPRPHALSHNDHYRELIPKYMLRHKVKPGITGWAQVNGLRGETDTVDKMEARVQADIYYIENWSLWFDLKIIFMTVFKGLVGKNAY